MTTMIMTNMKTLAVKADGNHYENAGRKG